MADEPVRIPITGELDLHTFRPQDVKDLVPEYLAECRAKGLRTVRVIHGKGIGNLRRTVHALLERDSNVESFTLAGEQQGSWGATMVLLKPKEG
jgi:DNA-nicking Smr family endonuclease